MNTNRCWLICICVLAYVIAADATPGIAQAKDAASASETPLQEVTVIGKLDARTLNHAIHQFVQSHAEPGAHIHQIGRWFEDVCPTVSGLQSAGDHFVSDRIMKVARAVGAPTRPPGKKCSVNVNVVFTLSPQQLVDYIAKKYRPVLGYIPTSERQQSLTFSRPIEAWYVTGTRTLDYQPPILSSEVGAEAPTRDITLDFTPGLHVDSYKSATEFGPSGVAGSHLGKGQRSEFVDVLIIVDSKAVAKHPLLGISDYVAMLALTRLAPTDTCSELPSIVNLQATGCTAVPSTITTADIAYLKGLYGASLDKNLNIELGEMHEGMRREMQER